MKKFFPLIFLGVSAFFIYKKNNETKPQQNVKTYSSKTSQQNNRSNRTRNNQNSKNYEIYKDWPPSSDDLADNLLADNYLILFDDSGSMRRSVANNIRKIDEAKSALKELFKILPDGINIGLMTLNKEKPYIELSELNSSNRENFIDQISLLKVRGGTPLVKSIHKAYLYLTKQASKQKSYGSYHLIIVTDGKSGDGDPSYIANKIVDNSLIQLHAIGFHVNKHSLNIEGIVDYHTASSASDLEKAFKAVVAESEEFK